MTTIELRAPLDGVILPIEQVPDPVFAKKMVGDGLSIDPLNQLLTAPCAGTVTQLHRAGHAVTLTTAELTFRTPFALRGRYFSPAPL